ncbi:MAG: mannonate dehydratase [Planctomycetota bacterium]|nr:mannonate dehydratase [Planctomycetota bacterium]
MHRRQFIAAAAGVSLVGGGQSQAAGSAATPQRPPPSPTMHLGTQQGPTTAEMLDYFKRHGVEAVCGYPPTSGGREYWTRQELEQTRDLCQQHGIALEMVALPLLSSSHIDRERRGAILLAQDPERTGDIEQIGQMIAACAQAGIPAFKYNLSLLGVLRTAATPGRGGARYSTWRLREAQESPPLTRAGRVTAELFWERVTWFLDRMLPICGEYKVRAACHPHDPGVPPQGFQGVTSVLGTPAGLKRFISIQESASMSTNRAEPEHDDTALSRSLR